MWLSKLRATPGSRKRRKLLGRGPGSGHGKTSGKGEKGQLSRSGGGKGPAFEGGQMPLTRRIPKRGFSHKAFTRPYVVINVEQLNRFEDGATVTPAALFERGMVRSKRLEVKILGDGELTKRLDVHAHGFSESARNKIIEAKGTVTVIE